MEQYITNLTKGWIFAVLDVQLRRQNPCPESTGMEQARTNGNVQLWTSHMMMMMMNYVAYNRHL